MGSSFLTKWLLIGLVIGLVLGFSGGYYYNNLNAGAPVTATTTNYKSVSNEAFAKSFALKLAPVLYETNTQSPTSKSPNESILAGLTGLIVPTAHAQTTCEGPNGGKIEAAAKAVLADMFGSFDSGCREAVLTGSVHAEMYAKLPAKDGYIKVKFDAHAVVRQLSPDCKTVITISDAALTGEFIVHITADGKSELVDQIPAGYKMYCQMTVTLNLPPIGTIDKNKCPWCVKSVNSVNTGVVN